MKKFAFELQGVLEIKEKLEGQAKIDFGIARAALNEEEAKRDAIIAQITACRDRLTELMNGALNLVEINRCKEAVDIYEANLKSQMYAVRRAEKRVEVARNKLNTVVMERKTIEKLRTKRFDEYLQEYNAEERKQVDELVSYRHSVPTEEKGEQT